MTMSLASSTPVIDAASIVKQAQTCLERLIEIAAPLADAAAAEQLAARAIAAGSAAIFPGDRTDPTHKKNVESAIAAAVAKLTAPDRHRAKLSNLAHEAVELIAHLKSLSADLADPDEARRRGQTAMKANYLLAREYFESCEQENFRSPIDQAIHFLRAHAACQFRIGSLADVEAFVATLTIEQSVRRDPSRENKSRLASQNGITNKDVIRIGNRKRAA